MSRYILEGAFTEVYTAALQGDVKPSVPGCCLSWSCSCASPTLLVV